MADNDQDIPAFPGWIITFGDMMSLLLTFFIMLVSLSEIKEEETYQALVDSVQRQFGYTRTVDALAPGDSRPRSSAYSTLATTGRAKRKDTAKGGVPHKAPQGEEPSVRIIRPGQLTAIGSVIFFEMGSDELSAQAESAIRELAVELRGKPHKIEVRGHVCAEYAARTADTEEALLLGFRRAIAVRRALVETECLDPSRFRVTSAGDAEPMSLGDRANSAIKNSRVEVFMLDETVSDLRETIAADDARDHAVNTEHQQKP